MEIRRRLSKIGTGVLAQSVFFLSRYYSPDVFDSLTGGADGRANLEHGFFGMGTVLLLNGIGLNLKTASIYYAGSRVLAEVLQSNGFQSSIQIGDLLSDGTGILLGVACCALLDRCFPKSIKGS